MLQHDGNHPLKHRGSRPYHTRCCFVCIVYILFSYFIHSYVIHIYHITPLVAICMLCMYALTHVIIYSYTTYYIPSCYHKLYSIMYHQSQTFKNYHKHVSKYIHIYIYTIYINTPHMYIHLTTYTPLYTTIDKYIFTYTHQHTHVRAQQMYVVGMACRVPLYVGLCVSFVCVPLLSFLLSGLHCRHRCWYLYWHGLCAQITLKLYIISRHKYKHIVHS